MADKTLVYYLAGPMRPLPENNFPLFEKASKMLRLAGYKIISPHELGDSATMTRGALMAEDLIALIMGSQGVIVLPDWDISPGASTEVAVGFATEKPIYDMDISDGGFTLTPSQAVSTFVPRETQYAEGIPLIGLAGFAQSGKDTVASFLTNNHGWTRVAFADALRAVLYALNPIVDHETLDVFEFGREAPVETLVIEDRVQPLVNDDGWDDVKVRYQEVRDLLQRLGTEAGRDQINQQLWVRLGEEKIERAGGPVIVTDCRFQNEVQMIRRRKGKLIWVARPGVGAVNKHASEHSVTSQDCDFTLINDGTFAELHKDIKQLIKAWKMEGDTSWGNETGIVSALPVSV